MRIGCYICHCGINIANRVRVGEVAAFAGGLKDVAISRDYKFMCSDPGQEMIERDIHDYGLTRVVVASCSPRLHEKTFQAACRRAGLNPYMFQMASVREQVSWVTADEDEATLKAKTLVAGAVSRVRLHRGLEQREVYVHPDIMVVGGGIAGMQAALDIGNSGHTVYLVEKDTTVGGHMLQFDKTFPTLDCAACIGTPKMVETAQNENIKLFSYSEVKEISGYIGNYDVTIRRKPRYIKEGVCTGCGECANVCPVSLPSEWNEGLVERQAIYRSFPQAVPITFCIDKRDRAPCVRTCPVGVNIQGYVQMIKEGKYEAAVRLIMERIPLPGVLGRVCPHPCEVECRRREVDEPVAIRDLKRFAADQVDFETLPVPDIVEKNEKIAVIGSGPAGLTVAFDLRKDGYQVTVFEALEQLGGMLRVGIPDYRLPGDVLDREIGYISRMGVEFKTGQRFNTDFTVNDLKQQGYSAAFLGIGAHERIKLGIAGEDAETGVYDAVRFLRDVNLTGTARIGKDVIVIGGGNVAMDACRTAKRLGAETVKLAYRRSREDMPAYADEIEGAEEESIQFYFMTAPVRVVTDAGKATGLECIRTEPGPPDISGRRRPTPVEGSEFVIPCDTLIPAIGQQIDTSHADAQPSLDYSRRGRLVVNPDTMQTSEPFLFAGGDAVTGPATVVEALAAGHRAAQGIKDYIRGRLKQENPEELEDAESPVSPKEDQWRSIPKDCEIEKREKMSWLPPDVRSSGFSEEALGYEEDQARREAARCLNCGVCCECMECVKVCEAGAIDHSMKETEEKVKVGSVILATGYDIMNPAPLKQYGYGTFANVFTSLEFERLSNATGPTGGEILIRDDDRRFTRKPDSVAILHCIGSRDVHYHEYCSRVCCMYALKYAHLIKEKVGHDTPVYNFYIDMRCFGKGYEEFYRRCREEGTHFIRGKVSGITAGAKTVHEQGKLIITAEDTLIGRVIRIPVDMAVLCVAMEARSDAQDVGRMFGVNQGADGFFLEEHPKLGPLNTSTDGVFLAGACQSPKDIPDTVAQASGAASKALSLATRGKVEIPSTISWIDPDVCAGCQMCIGLCPYGAVYFDDFQGVSVVNAALCKGCGSCSGVCPSGAAQVRHFNKRQVFAEIDGIIDAISVVEHKKMAHV